MLRWAEGKGHRTATLTRCTPQPQLPPSPEVRAQARRAAGSSGLASPAPRPAAQPRGENRAYLSRVPRSASASAARCEPRVVLLREPPLRPPRRTCGRRGGAAHVTPERPPRGTAPDRRL